MSPEQTAVAFYKSAFPDFERHFRRGAVTASMTWLRQEHPDLWATWAEGDPSPSADPDSDLDSSLDVFVSPDGKEVIAATVGVTRGVYLRLEMKARRALLGWTKAPITQTAGFEAEALNGLVDLTEELQAAGWTRHVVDDGEVMEE